MICRPDYSAVAFSASDSLDGADDNASGGMLRFYGQLDLVGKGEKNTRAWAPATWVWARKAITRARRSTGSISTVVTINSILVRLILATSPVIILVE
jgi:hypothetical protein